MRKKDPPIRVGEGGMVDLAEAAVRQYHPGRGNRGKNRPSFVHPSPSARGMASGLSIGGKAPSLDDQERRR